MIKITTQNYGEISSTISTLNDNGDGLAAITISDNNVTKGMVMLTANELALLIKDLKKVYLSLAGIEE